ncbi:hypothetical protein B0H19DRAFT_1103276 [Mycena capillaripes]|nr:hypothetical protein B0H19DRAFT_1103276 [Mycena capillaripes]
MNRMIILFFQSLLSCIVQLLPKDSPWVHAIRAHIRYRMMLGLHCITDEQIERKEKYQLRYGKWCMKITEKCGYNFDFPKQHNSHHSSAEIRAKEVPSVYCTRVNEGHHKETRDAYALGNHRNNDRHVTQVDATKEAMARIRMTVDEYDREVRKRTADVAQHAAVTTESVEAAEKTAICHDAPHWPLGSGEKLIDSRWAMNSVGWIDTKTKNTFDINLRRFLRDTFPDEYIRDDGEQSIKIRPHKCIYLDYTSLEDFTAKFDVLQYNPNFQVNQVKRFDFVNVNMDNDPLSLARILYLFRCTLPSSREKDVALVQLLRGSRWQPNTLSENCRILENGRIMFMLLQYFARGAHMINAFGSRKQDSTYYLNDVVDSDWFLRAAN